MPFTILHNPRCSKSRQTLALLEEAGVETNIVEYLKTPPTATELQKYAAMLGMPLSELLRRKEPDFRDASDLPSLQDEAALADWVSRHPKVLERPIVIDPDGQRAILGRPPENVTELLRR